VTQQQRDAVDAMFRRAPRPFEPEPVEQMRAGFAALMARFPVREDVVTTPTTLGTRPALLVEPTSGASSVRRPGRAVEQPATILYFHGGSFVLGSPQTALGLTADLVARTGARAISLDYRLAPEHPFPAAIDDGLAAYRALLEAGVPASSIAFAGDSAGGGLSVTVTLAARAAGLPLPAAVVAFSPGLDHTRSGASMEAKAGIDPFFTREGMDHTGRMYLGGQDPHQELLAPAVLADLSGFPPLLLQVGTNELLLDDSTRLAERARAAGVDVVLDVTAGVPHVFQAFVGLLEEAEQALDRAALFLAQHLAVVAAWTAPGTAPVQRSPAGR
jgi:monoterpene epsilon-lactone hydrolase